MKTIFLLLLFFNSQAAFSATADISIANTVSASILSAATLILPMAMTWLFAFSSMQFFITSYGLLKSGADMDAVIIKLAASFTWVLLCIYFINHGPEFIDKVGNGLLTQFAPHIPSAGSILISTLALCSALLTAVILTGTTVLGTGNTGLTQVLVFLLMTVAGVGLFMAIKVMMLTLELSLVVMLSPLSFAFLGMNALKDQGIAPFKSLISLAYRIILMGIIFAAFSKVMDTTIAQWNGINWLNVKGWSDSVSLIISTLFAFPILAFLAYKSDSIASALASGGTNLGTADVSAAAAMGAAAGAAAGSGAGGVSGAVGKAPQAMSDFISNLKGGGSVSNASGGDGTGGKAPVGQAPVMPPQASMNYSPPKPVTPDSGPGLPSDPSPTGLSGGSPTGSSGDAAAPSGNGSSAGIGGAGGGGGSDLEKNLGKLVDSMSQPAKQPSFADRMGELNQHVSRESAATHVSINANHQE